MIDAVLEGGHLNKALVTYVNIYHAVPAYLLYQENQWTCAHFVDCATQGVNYLWLCSCGSYYVDKTVQAFRIRIREHLYAANISDLLSPIGRH